MYEKVIKYTWKDFENATDSIAKQIREKYGDRNYALLGLARGGLPLMTAVSHQLDNTNISVIDVKMTGNDGYSESNVPKIIGSFVRDDIDEFILFEDIIVTGKSVEEASKYLESINKKVLAVYTMNLIDSFENKYFEEKNIEVIGYNKTDRNDWVEFPWESKRI